MRITYNGPCAEVVIPATEDSVKRGESVDVEDATAKGLLAQGTWSKAKAEKPAPVPVEQNTKAEEAK